MTGRPFKGLDIAAIATLRTAVERYSSEATIEDAAQQFTELLATSFSSVVLARMFVMTELATLPAAERAIAEAVDPTRKLTDKTPCLALLGTRGRELAWNQRTTSNGHRAIPLIDREFVEAAPMLAQLFASLDVEISRLDEGTQVATRRLAGGRNARFYVADAITAVNASGAHIIANREFVERYRVRTVFGFGGAYLGGTLISCLVFSTESIDALTVDLFPSLISNFKMATSQMMADRRIFHAT